MQRDKLLYVASTASHLNRFHQPYLKALRDCADVQTMANGEGVDHCVPFAKSFFSPANLRCVFQIRKILKREGFDAILLHTTLAAVLVRLATFGMRQRPYILNVVHGYLFQKNGKGLKHQFLLLCERILRNKTDDIAVMNSDDAEIAKRYRLCKGRIFETKGMGIPDLLAPAVPLPGLREALGVLPEERLCCFVGELSRRKNQAFLIRCMGELKREGIPIKLLLLGEGNEREALEKQISRQGLSDAVILAGSCETVADYLAVTDVYVSASTSEGLPFNIMEAMALGLPILASDTKGQSDLLAAYAGTLYPHGDMTAFCDAIKALQKEGSLGVGSRNYPSLAQYRLSSVFAENMKILTLGFKQYDMEH